MTNEVRGYAALAPTPIWRFSNLSAASRVGPAFRSCHNGHTLNSSIIAS